MFLLLPHPVADTRLLDVSFVQRKFLIRSLNSLPSKECRIFKTTGLALRLLNQHPLTLFAVKCFKLNHMIRLLNKPY